MLGLLTFGAVCFSLLYIYFKISFTYWKSKKVPYIKPIFPFGNLRQTFLFRKHIAEEFEELYEELRGKKYAGYYTFHRPGLMLLEPETIRQVLVKDFDHFEQRGFHFVSENAPLNEHLFYVEGDRWRHLRTTLSPLFSATNIEKMFPSMQEVTEALDTAVQGRKDQIVEMRDFLARFNTDIIASCVFGVQSNCLKNSNADFRNWSKRVLEENIALRFMKLLNFVSPAIAKRMNDRSFSDRTAKYFIDMVKDTVKYRETKHIERADFMHYLIQLMGKDETNNNEETEMLSQDKQTVNNEESNGHANGISNGSSNGTCNGGHYVESKQGLSVSQVAAQAFVFLLGDLETSSSTGSFCLQELAANPGLQTRVREDITNAIEKHGGLTYQALSEMKLLDAAIAETLRKYPPLGVLNRVCTKDYNIPGTKTVVKRGTRVLVPVLAIHRDSKYYPDPHRFDPDRFLGDEQPKAYLPFGEGPRNCIGSKFGLLQVKLGLAAVLYRCEVCICYKTELPVRLNPRSFVLAPSTGIWLQLNAHQR